MTTSGARNPTIARSPARLAGWTLMFVLALGMGGYALGYVIFGDSMYVDVLADSFRSRPWGIYPHALLGTLAIVLGPLQFVGTILRRWRGTHRAIGRIYATCALMTGFSGLYMAVYSYGGLSTHLGFGGMAVVTLLTTAVAWRRIRARDVAAHRIWMVRSYSVIFSAVTFRVWLPALTAAFDGDFEAAYQWASWMAWVPNLLVVEAYVRMSTPGRRLVQWAQALPAASGRADGRPA